MLSLPNIASASFLVITSYIFYTASVPPTPPATATETKKQIPWVRLWGFANASITTFFMLLQAYRLFIGQGSNKLLGNICSPSALRASEHLPQGALIGLAILVAGGVVRIRAQRVLGKYFTWEVSLKEDHKLCTIGPYSFVRHPGYLGLWGIRLGIEIYHASNGTVLSECVLPRYPFLTHFFLRESNIMSLTVFIWMAFRAKWEDDMLKKEFSVAWGKWADKTPYRVVPYIY